MKVLNTCFFEKASLSFLLLGEIIGDGTVLFKFCSFFPLSFVKMLDVRSIFGSRKDCRSFSKGCVVFSVL